MSNTSEWETPSALLAMRLTIELFDSGAGAPLLPVELDETAAPRPDLSQPAFDSDCVACGSDSDLIVAPGAAEAIP